MSSSFQPKRKELAKVSVISTEQYKSGRANFRLVGSVQRVCPNFITTQRNQKTGRCSFVDDTSSLTKRSKNALVQFFMDKKNKRKEVAYLVVPKQSFKKSTKKK